MAPPLLDELIEEVLLRFPSHEPARLIQAALVCKRWCRLVSEPRFRRRFREFHRSPPMLGFLCNLGGFGHFDDVARFVPTTSFCSPQADRRHWRALDARHGRVLIRRGYGICSTSSDEDALVVWNPITGEEQELPIAPRYSLRWTAAVLCAHTGACDHLDCHSGSFRIVFLGCNRNETFIYVYSSKDDLWSEPISTPQPLYHVDSVPSVLIRNTLYFLLHASYKILTYDLQTHDISFIQLPPAYSNCFAAVLITTEVGGLGFATERESKLYMWSREVTPEVDGGWVLSRTIELETLLPNYALLSLPHVVGFADGLLSLPHVVGFADDIGVIFLKGANGVVFTIDLKTYKVKKVCEGHNIRCIVPYMSFYAPDPSWLSLTRHWEQLVQVRGQALVPQVHEKKIKVLM